MFFRGGKSGMKQLCFIVMVLFLGCIIISGCTGGRTVGQTIDDTWILSKVKSKLSATSAVYAIDINVDVFDSEVTLRGIVENEDEAKRIEDIVLNIKGVSAVHNKLTIVPEGAEEKEEVEEEKEEKVTKPKKKTTTPSTDL
ncbi:MAG: BON domain-containing protein [Candidatus Hydrogenedentota bacterium]